MNKFHVKRSFSGAVSPKLTFFVIFEFSQTSFVFTVFR